jgi:hypothetical protein
VLGPGIDERHVLARLHHMGAGIPADSTSSNNSYLPTHAFPLAFLAAPDATGPLIVGSHLSGSGPFAKRFRQFAKLMYHVTRAAGFLADRGAWRKSGVALE